MLSILSDAFSLKLITLVIWTVVLWVSYVIAMALYKVRDKLKTKNRALYYLGYLFVACALVLDVIYNVVIGSIMFLDRPRFLRWPPELTFTARLKRYRSGPDNWRYRLATFICCRLLNRFDPRGHHC